MQDNRITGLSTQAKMTRKKRNLVSTKFNMFNCLLEGGAGLIVFMVKEKILFNILYLLVTSCGTPLVYYLGMEENRRKAREYFQSRIRIFTPCRGNQVAPTNE